MTKKEAWVRFAAAALADNTTSVDTAARMADKMLLLMQKRWPQGRRDYEDPLEVDRKPKKAEEGGKDDA